MNNTFTEQIFTRSKPSRRAIASNLEFPVTEKDCSLRFLRKKRTNSKVDIETDIEDSPQKPKAKKLKKLIKSCQKLSLSRFAKSKSSSKRLSRKLSWGMGSKSNIEEIIVPANAPCDAKKKVILGSNEEEVDDVVIWEEKYSNPTILIAFL